RHHRLDLRRSRCVRMAMRRARPLYQSLPAFLLAATHPLVAGRSAERKALTQFTHAELSTPPRPQKSFAFFHGTGLLPRHSASSLPHTLSYLSTMCAVLSVKHR